MKSACKAVTLAAVFAMVCLSGVQATEIPAPPKQNWSFDGVFGTYDRTALRRGLQVYRDVCGYCHGLKFVPFRMLSGVDFSADEIKDLAAEYDIRAEPNETGQIFDDDGIRLTRAGAPTDAFPSPYANDKEARYFNDGSLPADLSLMTKARRAGPDYLYALLTRYLETPPEGFVLVDGKFYNEVFVGHQIGMAPPLDDGLVTYEDGVEATLDQMARDVTVFLTWAAEPRMEERKSIGRVFFIVTLLLCVMLALVNRRIWKKVKSGSLFNDKALSRASTTVVPADTSWASATWRSR